MKTLLIGINSKYIHPAMSVFQLVANSKTSVDFFEFTIKDDNQTIINYIENSVFDLLGFSVYIWNITKIKEIISKLKHVKMIVLGGPEVSYRPHDFFEFDNVHFIIKNEGELAFNELIEHLQGNREKKDVSNLYYRLDKFNYTFDKNPDIKLINHDYSLIKDFKNRIVYLEASRGCCFQCSYCLASLEKTIRYYPLDKVKADITYALYQKAKIVKFLDRSFNVDQKHMREILTFLKTYDNNITTFQFEIVGDLLDQETIQLINTIRKGLIRFEIGIQSTNDVVTKSVRRIQNFDLLKANVLAIKDNVIIHTDLIAGLPYEDKQSFINTFNQTFDLYCEELQLGFLKELQGTFISETKDFHDYEFSITPPYEVIKNKYLSESDIIEIKLVEASLNRYYNSNLFPRTCNYLFKDLSLNPYAVFLKITTFINQWHELFSLQPSELAKMLYLSLRDICGDKLLYIIKQDYLMKNKIKPKSWWESNISKLERNTVYQKFIIKYPSLDIETLYRYSKLEKYQDQYFLVTYKPNNIYYLNT